MTPAQSLSTIRNQLNETTANFFTDAEIYAYMWEAETLLAHEIGYVKKTTAHTTVTDQSVYTCPDNYVKIARVTYDGKKLKQVNDVDVDRLDGATYGSTVQSGKPEVYKKWGDDVTLWPTPEEDKELYFEFYKSPDQITTDSTLFTITDGAIQQMIGDYVLYKCFHKDLEVQKAEKHFAVWNANLSRAYMLARDRDGWDEMSTVKDEDEYAAGSLGMD